MTEQERKDAVEKGREKILNEAILKGLKKRSTRGLQNRNSSPSRAQEGQRRTNVSSKNLVSLVSNKPLGPKLTGQNNGRTNKRGAVACSLPKLDKVFSLNAPQNIQNETHESQRNMLVSMTPKMKL